MSTTTPSEEKRKQILVVDDDSQLREIIADGLSTAGYDCQQAGDADEAFEALSAEQADLILLDVGLPGVSGIDMLPRLKSEHPELAIVILTGEDDVSTAVWAMREGASDYATKPITLPEVIIRVENALYRQTIEAENLEYQRRLESE